MAPLQIRKNKKSIKKYASIKTDFSFKKNFGSQVNKDIIISLINEVLKNIRVEEIKNIVFLNTFLNPSVQKQKLCIVDILFKDTDTGDFFVIEMQDKKTKFFDKRAELYSTKVFNEQAERGMDYTKLKKVYFIAFCNNIVFEDSKNYKSVIVNSNSTNNNAQDLKSLTYIFYEFPLFHVEEPVTAEEKWIFFLKYFDCDDQSVQQMILSFKNKQIQAAISALKLSLWNPVEKALYETNQLCAKDLELTIENAKEEGFRSFIPILKKLLKDGEDADDICLRTGLNEDELNKFKTTLMSKQGEL